LADCLGKYSYNANDFALDPTNEGTYQVLDTLVGDLSNAVAAAYTADLATTADTTAPARATTAATAVDSATTAAPAPPPFALHLGGDEVVYGCWANDSSIVGWMEVNGFASGDYDALLGYFVAKAQAIAKNRGELRPTHWEEVFKAGLASTVVPETIFQVWTGAEYVSECTLANFSTVASPREFWYLDLPENTWEVMYDYDPSVGLSDAQNVLLLGGEVAMWGEHVDASNFDSFVHPRAEAVAERLWSTAARGMSSEGDPAILARLLEHRCRLLQRGVGSTPLQPGFCAATWV